MDFGEVVERLAKEKNEYEARGIDVKNVLIPQGDETPTQEDTASEEQ
jgi:hypothetical protein